MIWLGLLLGCLGVTDLVRWNTEPLSVRTVLGCPLGGALAAAVLWLGGVGGATTVGTALVLTLIATVWIGTTSRPLQQGRGTWAALTVALAVLVAAVVASPWSPDLGGRLARWYAAVPLPVLSGVPLDRFVLVVGCALLLTNSGNVIVRLVLTAAGSKVTRTEQQIKGGRVLGPMERLLILGLGLAGQLAAASIIVAAKGLLRFPELQSYRQELHGPERSALGSQRIDVLTEYFLIGSLTSWSLALTCLLLS
jgi:hypothetical protein